MTFTNQYNEKYFVDFPSLRSSVPGSMAYVQAIVYLCIKIYLNLFSRFSVLVSITICEVAYSMNNSILSFFNIGLLTNVLVGFVIF